MNEDEIRQYVMDEAVLHNVSKPQVFKVWQMSYELHKKIYGSFKHLREDYSQKMNERYQFCGMECLDYIIAKHEEKKSVK